MALHDHKFEFCYCYIDYEKICNLCGQGTSTFTLAGGIKLLVYGTDL